MAAVDYKGEPFKTAKKDHQAIVKNANRNPKPTDGAVIRTFIIEGYTCLTRCPDRPRIMIGSVSCKQCWNLIIYDGERYYVKCKAEAEK